MKKIFLYLMLLTSAFALTFCKPKGRDCEATSSSDTVKAEIHRFGFNPDTLSAITGNVKHNEFFADILTKLGMQYSEVYELASASDSVFDVRKIRVGNSWTAFYPTDSLAKERKTLLYLVYSMDKVTDVVFKCTKPYSVKKSNKPIDTERKTASITIKSSLWNDMIEEGVSPLLILELSDIYAWTVDFFGLKKGDSFKVVYDLKLCEGQPIAVDTVRYAVYSTQGHDYPAIMFNQGDGGNIYWNEKGESMRKAFLKAPLRYSRISSGFSYSRKHPVTRKIQPHTGVDYAAPKGTPVMTIGDGVVTSVRYEGAGGNVVRIRHNSVYSTAYLHLSGYAPGIKAGKRVSQGDVIGYVGSTGRSTGPHLDFRVWKNGSPINPLKMQSPPAEPIKTENKAAFDSLYSQVRALF